MDKNDIVTSAKCIACYTTHCLGNTFSEIYFDELCLIIADVICQWCGNTYVGQAKDKETENSFQLFFTNLLNLINKIQMVSGVSHDLERDLANSLIYTGDIYRYLGHSTPFKCNDIVIPQYNDIFVSWSKESENSYLISKLYGSVTWIHAKINPEEIGFDLVSFSEFYHKHTGETFMIARPSEHEVIFPTVEKNVDEIKYFER